jgi:hypothetical protein
MEKGLCVEKKQDKSNKNFLLHEKEKKYIRLRNRIYKNLFGVSVIILARNREESWKMKSTLNSFNLTVFHSLCVLPCMEQIQLNKWKIKFSLYVFSRLCYLMKCPKDLFLFVVVFRSIVLLPSLSVYVLKAVIFSALLLFPFSCIGEITRI